MKDIILIPTYNERENIEEIITRVFKAVPECFVFVIDDNSPDRTAEIVLNLIKKYPSLSIINRKEKSGLGAAYKETLKTLVNDQTIRSITTMDADGSHNPDYLPILLDKIKQYDLVIGSRYVKGGEVENWVFWRKCLSYFGNLYSRILTGSKINDMTSGFMCVRRKLLEKIDFEKMSAAGYAYQIEFKNACSNFTSNICEIPIIFEERREGQSKISSNIITEGLLTPIKILFSRI